MKDKKWKNEKKLEGLAAEIRICTKCSLYKSRVKAVPGEGDPKARIFLIGESPGRDENRTGRPFVGRAGKFLDEMLVASKIEREELFITNVVKCHPPENRDPRREEVRICITNYLFNQISLIDPRIVVLLGRHPTSVFFPEIEKMSDVHGKIIKKYDLIFIILYHPALAIHRQDLKDVLRKDFKNISKALTMVSLQKNEIML